MSRVGFEMPDFFKFDTADVLKALADLSEKDAPFIAAYALTQMAKDIQATERASMSTVFDRPINWTLALCASGDQS